MRTRLEAVAVYIKDAQEAGYTFNQSIDMAIKKYRMFIHTYIEANCDEFLDVDGTLICTKSGEDVADYFDLYYVNYDIPEEIFEIAYEVAEKLGLLEVNE
jgi:hypothetical protein